jgi:HEAT repeat protein
MAFGQAFQTVFKVSAMYSVDHPAAARAVQQCWDLLIPLLKAGGPFTFGFMNQRILLNTSLATQTNVTHLEVEFIKREIGAITFQPGVELKDFKRALALLTTRAMVIAERGGIQKFLAANPIAGVRITPAPKPKEEDSDMIEVGGDVESILTGQAAPPSDAHAANMALDMLLEAAGVQKPQGLAGNPRELVEVAEEAARNTVADPDGNVSELLIAMTQMLSAMKPDSLLSSLPPEKQADLRGHSPGVMAAHLMEDAIAGWATDRLRAAAGGGGAGGSGGVGGAGGIGGASSAGGAGGVGVAGSGAIESSQGSAESDVLQILLRGLKATRVPDRLLQKLSQFVDQANLPTETFERIRREVTWFTLPAEKKHAQLLSQERYTPADFTRLVQYVQQAMSEGRTSEAAEVAQHYFSTWEKAPSSVRTEEMKRAPELLRILASVQTLPLMHSLAEQLLREILDETRLHWPSHQEATHCLAMVAQNAGRFEDFEFVHKIGSDLKRLITRRPDQHADCCAKALSEFLTPEALERLIESFLQRRSDPVWVHTASSLLAMTGPPGAEAAQRRLDDEPVASNRLPLIRLIRGLGASAIEATRKRLSSERWEVVRNAAYILGDLGDPELPTQLRGALRHADFRVQQAAVTGILKSSVAGRGEVLAEALPELQAGVLEMALDELTVLKDPASVKHLEALVLGKKELKAGVLEKAVIALGAVPTDPAAEALYKIIVDAAQPLLVRRTALGGLYNHASAIAAGLVAKLASLPPGDPLVAEVKKVA